MKKLLFGISLLFFGVIGVLTLILCACFVSVQLGIINSNTNVFAYFDYYGITIFFYIFAAMGISGIIICVIDLCRRK